MDGRNKLFLAVGAVAIVAAAAIGVVKIIGKESEGTATSTQSKVTSVASTPSSAASSATAAPSTSSSSTTSSVTTGTYKDGDYSATAAYRVPHGSNSIAVKLTIKDGKVAAVTTNSDYSDGESSYYIDSFASEIKGAVVGQSLDGLSLSRVGGASLTTEGFNQALDSIASQAKA